MRTLGILLAAGASRRFGAQDKLLADWHGAPLVLAAAHALEASGCDALLAIVSDERVGAALPASFDLRQLPRGLPLSRTWQMARDCAIELHAERALFVLGDMPSVSAETLRTLINSDGTRACVFNGTSLPPALLTAEDMRRVPDRDNDQGARALLRALPHQSLVPLTAQEACDIDTPEALRRTQENIRARP
ncbi:molybdenum cofactor cytidylyltransferase [Thioclava sp. ES.031]|uniref:NTP transferase domain-containing protein n=1 Tax=Thioclava sp. ES.031 TaxID=1798203 RepID=UPI000C0047BA|nr:NTP transferase domain-containing protein [Thioclava sp. ES.031]PFG61759.1 molybdenum cofactor cytidylyltransferase [Thioclava sp. ES.031]